MQNDQLINKLLNGHEIRHSNTLGVELFSTALQLPLQRIMVKQFEKFKRERIIVLDGSDGPFDIWKHRNRVAASGNIDNQQKHFDNNYPKESISISDTPDAAAQEV
jgi:hypothetical protein